MEESSILEDVRKAVGLEQDDTSFDSELKLHVNSALATLNQNGVGRTTIVNDASVTWADLKDPLQLVGNEVFEQVKLFVFLKTKILFDPPPPSNIPYVAEATNEVLWRLREAYTSYEEDDAWITT